MVILCLACIFAVKITPKFCTIYSNRVRMGKISGRGMLRYGQFFLLSLKDIWADLKCLILGSFLMMVTHILNAHTDAESLYVGKWSWMAMFSHQYPSNPWIAVEWRLIETWKAVGRRCVIESSLTLTAMRKLFSKLITLQRGKRRCFSLILISCSSVQCFL